MPRLPLNNARMAGMVIAILGLMAIAVLTLQPAPGQEAIVAELPVLCLVCGAMGGVDVTLNVLLFTPLGFGLRLSGVSVTRTVLVGALLSATIETVQYRFLAGRDASLSDFLTNTAGTALGAIAAGALPTLTWPPERARRRLAAAAAALAVALLALAGYAFQLSLPATTWWGQWRADLPQFDTFPGSVVDITLDGVTMPATRMRESGAARARMSGGHTAVDVVAVPAGPTSRTAPLASIYDGAKRQILLLGQNGRALVYNVRTRAHDLRLHGPAVRLDDAFSGADGDTLRLRGSFDRQTLAAEARDGRAVRRYAITPNLSAGWSLFVPGSYAFGPEARLFDALWMLALALPVGYWSWRRKRPAAALGPAAALLAALALLPLSMGYPPVGAAAWLGVSLGLGLGWIVGRVARGRRADQDSGVAV